MDIDSLTNSHWYPVILREIQQEMNKLLKDDSGREGSLLHEIECIADQKKGWMISLSDPKLPQSIRDEIHLDYQRAESRERDIKLQLERRQKREQYMSELLNPELVLESLNRLDDVLAGENATRGNLELSLHIDRIECFTDGHVKMKLCRLGPLPHCIEFMKHNSSKPEGEEQSDMLDGPPEHQATPRRRAKLRVESIGPEGKELESAAAFATDPERFTGIGPEWFEEIEFDVPHEKHWYQIYASEVFHRRQEKELSYAKLAKEFDVTPPTVRAAVEYYLDTHPDAKDNVKLQCGGKRPPKYDLSKIGPEARVLWESRWSKLKLAEKYGCSPPTIDKALEWSYAQDGLSMPTKEELQKAIATRARKLLDEEKSLEEISDIMDCSDVTARRYLKMSFEAEGKTMPDLRRKSAGT
ncbi:Sigma-70, region 4 [Gimesia fumaroli]|uniref:Sigma-70, region 4 n=2 Tax=Gimesia fumaroli TaxID=2527976 RepID=A0A518IGH5_9PLAN|nr:Sigma-70, region 4 [Gimesia fumaroli]